MGNIGADKSSHVMDYLQCGGCPTPPKNGNQNNIFNQNKNAAGNPLGAIDGLDLSPAANASYTMARAQFEVNLQTIKTISGPNGSSYEEINFSFNASFEFLQAASGNQPLKAEELEPENLIDKMQELFSPENTAKRILDFALAMYAPQGEGGEADRQEFADFIGDAIQKGFNEAQNILGKLEESIQEGIDKTHDLVFDGLNNFVKNGVPEGHEERSKSIRDYAEQFKMSVSMEYSSVRAYSYNSEGKLEQVEDGDAAAPFEISA
ncbi:MAG: DUF5610 domain-containing protein [Planctomycetota bacterium]